MFKINTLLYTKTCFLFASIFSAGMCFAFHHIALASILLGISIPINISRNITIKSKEYSDGAQDGYNEGYNIGYGKGILSEKETFPQDYLAEIKTTIKETFEIDDNPENYKNLRMLSHEIMSNDILEKTCTQATVYKNGTGLLIFEDKSILFMIEGYKKEKEEELCK